MSAQLQQIKTVTISGFGQVAIKANESTYKPSGQTREHHAGQRSKDGGYTETEEPASLEVTLNDKVGTDYHALNAVRDKTITIEYTKGKVEVMPEAWCAEPCDPDTGIVKVKFLSNESYGG